MAASENVDDSYINMNNIEEGGATQEKTNTASPGLTDNRPVLEKGRSHVTFNAEDNTPHNIDYDNRSQQFSTASSVKTADGISDITGFYVICLVVLVGDMARGIMFPTLWPLVESLGGTESSQGYAVAAFSFGRILVSPMFGRWSHIYGYSKTLRFSVSILLIGTLLYAQAANVGRLSFLFAAQIVIGIGSGTLGVSRAFVAEITPTRDRTKYVAWLTAVQYAGFTVTPFFGAIFKKIFSNEDWVIEKGFFVLNAYTSPAYFMFLVTGVTLTILFTIFQGRQRHSAPKRKSSRRAGIEDISNELIIGSLSLYEICLLGCMLLNVATKGSIATFETLGVTIAQSYFNLNNSEPGYIVSICGSIGVIALLSMGYISSVLNDIQIITYGTLVMAAGVLALCNLDGDAENPTWRYVLSIFMVYSVGYPVGHTAVLGMFSKIIGRRPQGELQGWFASAGSLARIVFPLMSGYLMEYVGVQALFIVIFCILGSAIIFTLLSREPLLMLSR